MSPLETNTRLVKTFLSRSVEMSATRNVIQRAVAQIGERKFWELEVVGAGPTSPILHEGQMVAAI